MYLKKFNIVYQYCLILVVVFLAGCAHNRSIRAQYEAVRQMVSEVTIEDGINEAEANLLAQNFILEKALDDRLESIRPYRIIKEITWLKGDERIKIVGKPSPNFKGELEKKWILLFKDKNNTLFRFFPMVPFVIEVNAESGAIMKWGLHSEYIGENTNE